MNVFPIRIPPLRERPKDIPIVVCHFTQQFAGRMNKRIESISSETMTAMCDHQWPGNIRELQNVIERAVILASGPVLRVGVSDLRTSDCSTPSCDSSAKPTNQGNLQRVLEETERRWILDALEQAHWVIEGPKGAVAHLGMKRSTLQARMLKLGIARSNTPVD